MKKQRTDLHFLGRGHEYGERIDNHRRLVVVASASFDYDTQSH